MNVDIRLANPSPENASWLGEVADSLEDDGRKVTRYTAKVAGARADLLEWIKLGVEGAGALIGLLTLLQNRRPKARINVRYGNREAVFDHADQEEIRRLREWVETPSVEERSLTVEVEE